MKSSRLPRKGLLKIGGLPSVSYCIRNALRLEGVDKVILATSYLEQDSVLESHTYDPSVAFFTGHPENVISRFLAAAEAHRIDQIVRVTADMPYLSSSVLQVLLCEHRRSGADYTIGRRATLGTNFEIFSTRALRRLSSHFPRPDYSEYMTYYFQNNPDHFVLNFVELPSELVRDYRLTLDYPEDLELFQRIDEALGHDFRLPELLAYLDAHPELAGLNVRHQQIDETDEKLKTLLAQNTRIPG